MKLVGGDVGQRRRNINYKTNLGSRYEKLTSFKKLKAYRNPQAGQKPIDTAWDSDSEKEPSPKTQQGVRNKSLRQEGEVVWPPIYK